MPELNIEPHICKGKNHSSICDKITTTVLTTSSCSVTCPVVLIEIEGVKYRALIDTGAGGSYISSTLINHINKKPIRTETKEIETLIRTNTRKIKIYSVRTEDINCEFGFEMKLNHLEKEVLLGLPNQKYRELQNTYVHLKDLQINDHDPKGELSVHVILSISDYTKIKTQERTKVSLPGEPIAELTKFGWVIVSPGQETGITNMLFSKTSLHDYEKLCSLDCLGIEERRDYSNYVYEKF